MSRCRDLRRQGGLKIKVVLLMSGDRGWSTKPLSQQSTAQHRMLNANRLKYQEHGFQVFTLQGDIAPFQILDQALKLIIH